MTAAIDQVAPRRARGPLRVTHAIMPSYLFDQHQAEAVRRGVHVDVLTAAVMKIVAKDNLYAALLDG